MPEVHRARTLTSDIEFDVFDQPRLPSTELFLRTSNEIWDWKPVGTTARYFRRKAVMNPSEALDVCNAALREIDESIVMSRGVDKVLHVQSPRIDHKVDIRSGMLTDPVQACIGTYNYDDLGAGRAVDIDGENVGVMFTDGHLDFYRNVYSAFDFITDEGAIRLKYLISRDQSSQGETTSVAALLALSQLADLGYSSDFLGEADMSAKQEMNLLMTFRRIGGLGIS